MCFEHLKMDAEFQYPVIGRALNVVKFVSNIAIATDCLTKKSLNVCAPS